MAIFNIYDSLTDSWLSWKNVEKEANKLNIPTVPVLFKGVVKSEKELENMVGKFVKDKEFGVDEREGIVIRLAEEFKDFSNSIAKYVRKDHVLAGDDHWSHKEIVKNKLA